MSDSVTRDPSLPADESADAWVAAYIEEATRDGVAPSLRDWLDRTPSSCREAVERRLLAYLRFESIAHESSTPGVEDHSETSGGISGPMRFGDFQIVRRLAAGGMSLVYLAEQSSLGRLVALKILPPAFAAGGPSGERFRREAQIAAKLRHPNLVGVLAYGEAHGTSYIAFDFVEGETLAARVARQRAAGCSSLTESASREVAQLGVTIAEALAYAHAHGIVHRDVKPANVIVDADGVPHVVDFGLAKDACALSMSKTGDFLGTPQYMAPEQVDATFGEVDVRTDVYGLGALLYECLGLQPPHDGSSIERVVRQVIRSEPPALVSRRSGVPRDLATIVHTALEKNPDHRYQSAAELAADLRRFLEHRPILSRPISVWRRVGRFARRRSALVLGLALGLVLTISVPAVWFTREGMERERQRADQEQLARDGLRLLSEASSVLDADPGLALRLAIEGAQYAPGLIANNALYSAWRAVEDAGAERLVIDAHRGHVHRVVVDSTGDRIATASADKTAAVWRTSDGSLIARFVDHEAPVIDVALTRDGKRALTASLDGSARLWRIDSPSAAEWRQRTAGPVHFARFALDDRVIVVGSLDGTLSCYDSAPPFALRWRERGLPTVSVGRYTDIWSEVEAAIALSPDGERVAAGTWEDRLASWDVRTGERLWSTEPLSGRLTAVQFSRDGRRLVAYGSSLDRSWAADVWDATDGRHRVTLGNLAFGALRGVGISDDGERVTTSTGDACVLWDVSTGVALGRRARSDFVMPRQHFSSFVPGRTEIATTHLGGPVLLGPVESGEKPRALRSDESWITWLDFTPDGRCVVTGGQSGKLRVWALDREVGRAELRTGVGKVRSVRYGRHDARVLVGGEAGTVAEEYERGSGRRVWRVDTEGVRSILDGVDDPATPPSVSAVAVDPSSGEVSVLTPHHVLRRLDPSGELVLESPTPIVDVEYTLRSLAWSPDGTQCVFCARRRVDGRVYVARRGELSGPVALVGHHRAPRTAEFDADGARIVTASLDGLARVYRLPGVDPVLQLEHPNDVRHARFSPNGRLIATACWDRNVRVWDAESGALLRLLSGHRQSVEAIDFAPDGRTLVSGSLDGTARLWDVATGDPVAVVAFSGPVYSVAFRSDGAEFVVGGDSDRLAFWPFPPTEISAHSGSSSVRRDAHRLSSEERSRYSGRRAMGSGATPSPRESRAAVNELAHDLWQRSRDRDVPPHEVGPGPKMMAGRLEWLIDRAGPEFVGALGALVALRTGDPARAAGEAERCNTASLERVGRDDPVALAVLAEALWAIDDRARAAAALDRAEALVKRPPWNWAGDPDPATYLRSVRARLESRP